MKEMQKEFDLPKEVSKKTSSDKKHQNDETHNREQQMVKAVKTIVNSSISVEEAKVRAENEAIVAYKNQEYQHNKKVAEKEVEDIAEKEVIVKAAHKDTTTTLPQDKKVLEIDNEE